jgi:hypothetical protein
VPVPPPPHYEWNTTSPLTQQAEASSHGRTGTAGRLFVGCLVVAFGLFALFVGTAIVGGGGGNSPTDQAAEPDQEKRQQPSGDEEEANQAAGDGGMETAIVKVGGTPGIRFSGDVGNLDTTRSVDGVTPAQYEVKFSNDAWDLDSVYVSFYKEMNANANYPPGTLEVQIVVDGEVVQEASSSARDGYVNITWSPE